MLSLTVGLQIHHSEVVMIEAVHISINGVEAGSIPAEQYHALRRQPMRDRKVWLSQLRILLVAALNMATFGIMGLPGFFFLGLAMLLVWDQAMVVQVIRDIQASTPEQLVSGIRMLLDFAVLLIGYSLLLSCIIKSVRKSYGLRDCFAEESDRLIRVAIGAAATGPLKAYVYSPSGKIRTV